MTPEEESLVLDYRLLFGTPSGQRVMNDLMKYCKFRAACETQIDEGMRRAFLRVVNMTQLTDEQLRQVYGGNAIQLEPDE